MPVLDLQGGYLVCVSDDAQLQQLNPSKYLRGPQHGQIHSLEYAAAGALKVAKRHTAPAGGARADVPSGSSSAGSTHCTSLLFRRVGGFSVEHVRGATGRRTEGLGCHAIKISTELSLFMTSNLYGHVGLFDLITGEKLGQAGGFGLPGRGPKAP